MLGGIQTSIFTATNVFLDLLSSPPSSNYYLRLREEIESVFTSDDWESQKAIAKLVCTDSTIRESLRMSPILTRTGMREVVKKGGVQFPNGQTVPKGAWLAMPAVAIHYDEKFYPEPETYKPFRFVPDAPKAAVDTALLEVEDSPKESQYKVLSTSLSSASPTFLGFGYGRHSWYVLELDLYLANYFSPGRWFVALQLKLLVAYIISHYDIERIEQRPMHRIIGSHFVPPAISVKVRRLKDS